jgi:hypothetical protein
MRSYPRNSPEAAARIVALVMISDGHVCRSEIDALQGLEVERALGLPAGGFAPLVHTLCEDLLAASYASGSMLGQVDAEVLDALLDEVDAPELRRTVLQLAAAAAEADRHLAEAEAIVLAAARRRWGLEAPATAPLPQAA